MGIRNEVRNGGHFWHVDKRQGLYKLVLSFLMEVVRHVQNWKLVMFLQYIKKNCRNCFVFYCDAKHSDILWGSSHVHCYLLINHLEGMLPTSFSGAGINWEQQVYIKLEGLWDTFCKLSPRGFGEDSWFQAIQVSKTCFTRLKKHCFFQEREKNDWWK